MPAVRSALEMISDELREESAPFAALEQTSLPLSVSSICRAKILSIRRMWPARHIRARRPCIRLMAVSRIGLPSTSIYCQRANELPSFDHGGVFCTMTLLLGSTQVIFSLVRLLTSREAEPRVEVAHDPCSVQDSLSDSSSPPWCRKPHFEMLMLSPV